MAFALRRLAAPSTSLPTALRNVASRSLSTEATFETKVCEAYKIDAPPTSVTMTKDESMKMIKDMMTIRRMETAAGTLYRGKKIRGFCHLYSGQEAICVGMTEAMTRELDGLTTAYRVHGWAYSLGWDVDQIIAELLGNSLGVSKGKGGSMHMYGENFYGGNGIVGAQVPVGAGVAWAYKYLGQKGVSVSCYGDGAANQGQVFEAYNIAKLWDLPAIFVCENNKYGMGTSAARSSANTEYFKRGDYIPGLKVDAMDVLAVKNATAYAREYALENGPILLEMETYRYHGHSMSDPDTTYREKDEINSMRSNYDPILLLKNRIIEAGFSDEAELKAMEKDVRKDVNAAVARAEAAAPTAEDEIVADILAGEKASNVRGCDITISYSL